MTPDVSGQTDVSTAYASERRPVWSPDGRKLAFTSIRSSRREILVIDADGTGEHAVTTLNDDERPAWSPDGTKIAFSSTRADNTDVYVIGADGDSEVRLTTDPASDSHPDWSPDGTKLTFTSTRGGTDRIFVMNADGSNQKRLTSTGSNGDPDWGNGGCADADGDALCDSWETAGIDTDNDGTVDLDLPAMGAHPNHKDIFVEFDTMASHDLGPASVMNPVTGALWGALSEHDTIPHQDVLGTQDGAGHYDWTAFDALKATHFPEEREPAFHYALGVHQFGSPDQFAAGISRGSGSSDFIVSLGACQLPGLPDCNSGEEGQPARSCTN